MQRQEILGKALDSEGTGLGLYLVRTLVEQFGGRIWIEDNEPEGVIFKVELPKTTSETEVEDPDRPLSTV